MCGVWDASECFCLFLPQSKSNSKGGVHFVGFLFFFKESNLDLLKKPRKLKHNH